MSRTPSSQHPSMTNRSGMVLVVVLILVAVMAGLVLHLQYNARIQRQADQRQWQQARLRAALTDEAFARLAELANDVEPRVDHLEKPWMESRETERPDGITTLSRIVDMNRFADLNNLVLDEGFSGPNETERILIEAMTQAGDFTPIDRIEALTDWIDADTSGIRESDFYQTRTPPYRTPGTWLQTWDELRWIHGFSGEYLERKPLYTVGRPFSANFVDLIEIVPGPRTRPTPINLNTAPAEVLNSVFGPENEAIARYIAMARIDRPFRSIDALLAQLDPSLFHALSPFISIQSTHFLVEVHAFEAGQRAGLRALAQRDDEGRLRIVQWVM